MIGRDLHNTLSYLRGVSPQVGTDNTAFVSQIIDMADYLGLEFVIATGTLADADATFAVTMDESDASDLSGSNSVAAADMVPTPNNNNANSALSQASFIFSDDDAIKRIGYIGTKRYVRLTVTPSANTGNAPICVIAVGLPRYRGNVTGS